MCCIFEESREARAAGTGAAQGGGREESRAQRRRAALSPLAPREKGASTHAEEEVTGSDLFSVTATAVLGLGKQRQEQRDLSVMVAQRGDTWGAGEKRPESGCFES